MPPLPSSIIQKNQHIKKEAMPWILPISLTKSGNKKFTTTVCSKRTSISQELSSGFSSHGTYEKKKYDWPSEGSISSSGQQQLLQKQMQKTETKV